MRTYLYLLLTALLFSFTIYSEVTLHINDPEILDALELDNFSLDKVLSGMKSESSTRKLYSSNPLYKSFVDVVGQPLLHQKENDQLPKIIPNRSGDIPDIVRALRDFEDKGRRSPLDKKGGFRIQTLSNNSHHPYQVEYDGDEPRHFDYRWLNSPFSSFKLISVTNRIDKADQHLSSCGEIRFIYRLMYKTKETASSLPFFLNAVYEYPKEKNCASFAKRWIVPESKKSSAKEYINYLTHFALKNLSFKQLESNFQAVRFTSGYMHDFGGQAMYLQRVFKRLGNILIPIHLENTPSVLKIEKRPELLREFVSYLKKDQNLLRLDEGRLIIDFGRPEFFTKLSIHWSTLGRARTANKPFKKIFEKNEALLRSIDISKLKSIGNHEALVERLDNLTCMGCHQSGGTAGFHMLGRGREEYSHHFNRQELEMSPHSYAERARRKNYIHKVAKNKKPSLQRPHSNYPEADWTTVFFKEVPVKGLCTLPKTQFFPKLTCKSLNGKPTSCKETVKNSLFGECVLSEPRDHKELFAGGVCWKGTINESFSLKPETAYNLFSFTDKFKLEGAVHSNRGKRSQLGRYGCVLPKSGAPLGRRGRKCTKKEETLEVLDEIFISKPAVPEEICASLGGSGFDLCAAKGDSGSCLQSLVKRGMLDTCSEDTPCREDYICQKIPNYHEIPKAQYSRLKRGKRVNLVDPSEIKGNIIEDLHKKRIGFCVPTYFLFNMRADGHPNPVTGETPKAPKYDRTKPLRGYSK